MKNKASLLLILLLFSANTFGQYFKNINMKDGLSNPSVLSIYQDVLGRMWFGTNEGINIYDGRHMNVHKSYVSEVDGEVKLLNGNITQIIGDEGGDVFFRNNNALVKYDIENEKFKQIYASNVGSLAIINKKLAFSVQDTLFYYDSSTGKVEFYAKLDIPHIWCMQQDGDKIWLGTRNGLYMHADNKVTCVLPDYEIYRVFLSSRNELWIASRMNGLYKIGRDGVLTQEINSADRVVNQQIRDFVEDDKQNIWFGTFDGLQVYHPYTDSYKVYRPGNLPGTIEHQSVFSLYKDRQGTIWIGSYYGGVNYFNQSKDVFTYYTHNTEVKNSLSFPIVGEMVEDKDHDLWICTDGGGVNLLNRRTASFTHYTASGNNSILHNNIKSITYDAKRNQIYIGTYTGGVSRLDKQTGKVYNYLNDYIEKGVGPERIIYHCLFHDDWLYVSARNGFWRINPATNEAHIISDRRLFLTFDIDNLGYIWLAASHDLFRVKIDDWKSLERVGLDIFNNEKAKITKVIHAKDGTIYLSTLGNGVYSYCYDNDKWSQFTTKNNDLLSDFCYNIIETPLNNILVTCDKGFSIYSPFNQSMYSLELGLKGGISAITEGCGLWASSDDLIYIGGVDGMISFNEKSLSNETNAHSELYFSELFINNAKVNPGDSHDILEVGLPYTTKLRLTAGQNNLMIGFSNSNYVEHEKNIRYQYMLQGFDKDWVTSTQMQVNYTNLAPGNYTLRVREIINNANGKTPREILLNITIQHPWYATLWAYLLYLFIVAAIAYALWKIKQGRQAMALSLINEKNEKERIEELNKMKLRFFTNISHEFRTPLTLIIGQIEMLLQSDKLSPSIGRQLQSVFRNAINMRSLITELLDFRKQEQGYVKLKPACIDIIVYMRNAYQSFSDYARKRGINYSFECAEEKIDVWLDAVQLQKAILNLLSNAFKYTPENGNIRLTIRKLHRAVEIVVYDSGNGISKDDLSKIFERFYQVDENMQKGVLGTGIGLALTKSIIEAHHGEIKVDSILGKGSSFRMILPLGNAHFSSEELESSKNNWTSITWEDMFGYEEIMAKFKEGEYDSTESLADKAGKPVVLLVEDDEDILQLLSDIFSSSYTVYTATDGQMGFDMALQLQPDLVVSDVMMPIMSGKEMCYKIKNCLDISYIPVVLLTAQASDSHTLEGYMFGADDYITKPFNVKLLLTRCGNLLRNKHMLLKKVNRGEKVEQKEINTLNSVDQKLLDAATLIIRNNFDNTEFDVNMLAAGLNMGRSKMFGRLKEIAGITPNELILKLKLEEAVRLLEEEAQYNISEISYQLGFTSPRYFSRCFKAFYGVSPQNYRKVGTSPQ